MSIDKDYDSPFAMKARAYGYEWWGGKNDDIIVIVAQITNEIDWKHTIFDYTIYACQFKKNQIHSFGDIFDVHFVEYNS